MANTKFDHSIKSIAGYHLRDQLYVGHQAIIYRGHRQSDDQPVILKIAHDNLPPAVLHSSFQHEYMVLRSLHLAGVVTAYSLEMGQPRWVLVLEDFGGESLQRLGLAGQVTPDTFLRLAIRISEIVGQLHHCSIVHQDINPANIVLNPATAQVKLIDFGSSLVLPPTVLDRLPPEQFAIWQWRPTTVGTLAYSAPEQTGRTVRLLDQRADLYALGATFYELLAGQPPFVSSSAAGLVHAHLARPPMPLHEREPAVPHDLSAIIMRLLAKDPDDRYQSAQALQTDLERARWQHQASPPTYLVPPGATAGAEADARALLPEAREVLPMAPASPPDDQPLVALDSLDVASLLQSARVIASEPELRPLLGQLVCLLVENAGAQRGSLLLPDGGQWTIATECRLCPDGQWAIDDGQGQNLGSPAERLPLQIVANAVTHSKSLVLYDAYRTGPFANDSYVRANQARSIACLPLQAHGRLLGVCYLENNMLAGAFATDRLEVLQALASQAAAIAAFAQVSEALNQTANPREALQAGLAAAVALVGAESGWLWMVTENEEVRLVASTNLPPDLGLDQNPQHPQVRCECLRRVLAGDMTQPIPAVACQRLHATSASASGLDRHTTIPISAGGRPIGILNLVIAPTRPVGDDELRLFATISKEFGIGMERARLFAQVTETLEREQRLNEVTRIIGSALDLHTVLQSIVQRAVELVRAETGGMGLLTPDRARITFPNLFNLVSLEEMLRIERNLPKRATVLWQVIDSGQPVLLADYAETPQALPELVSAGVHGMMAVPIVAGDQCLGVLALYSMNPARRFSERDLALAESIGCQAGIAIQNARLFETERRNVQELKALREITNELTSVLDLDTLLHSILEQAVELLDVTCGELALYDEEQGNLFVLVSYNMSRNYTGIRLALGEDVLGQAALTRQPLIIDDYQAWEGASPQYEKVPDLPVLAMPLLAGGELVGCIMIGGYVSYRRRFEQADVERLQLLAQQATIAIKNARLFAEVQKLATTDALTGLHNRRHFFHLASDELDRAMGYGRLLSVVMLDVDHFKRVNDTYGHMVGDQVLCAVAETCRTTLRGTDIIGRYGGEEFAILLPDTSLENARHIAERLRATLAQTPIVAENTTLAITASLGVAALHPTEPLSIDALVDRADQALYAAKELGRNCIVVWVRGLA